MNKDIIELEKKFSHQEYIVSQLNDIVQEQGKKIERLQQNIQLLSSKVDENLIDSDRIISDEKPPHY